MTAKDRPNIALIHWHDVGRRVSPYEDHGVTPTLAGMAGDSVVFNQAFSTSPVCTPARGSLFTGKYPHRNGLMGLAHLGWRYNAGEQTLQALLSEAGYETALIGLQHEALDAKELGFSKVLQDDTLAPPGLGGHLAPDEAPQYCQPVGALAAEFLKARDGDSRPFFASIGFWEAHRPYPEDLYPPVTPTAKMVPGYLRDTPRVRADLGGFFGAVRAADQAVATILEALRSSGLHENTWVIFTTDHGEAFPRAKGTLYDRGVGVALMMRPPAGSAIEARAIDNMVSHLDVLPTCLDLAGVPIPADIDGESLLSRMTGQSRPGARQRIFAEQNWHDPDLYDPMRCIRTTQFKYIRSYGNNNVRRLPGDIAISLSVDGADERFMANKPTTELYDLIADPQERNNLAGRPEYAEVEAKLSRELVTWQERTSDPLLEGPIPSPPITRDDDQPPQRMEWQRG